MRFDRQQFQRTLTVCLALAIATTSKGNQSISLMPNDPEGLVGQDIHLWCSVSEGGTLRDANFTIVYRNKKTHHRLPAGDSIILNATTAMLTISNLTDAHDRAMVFCWAGRKSEFQIIRVGRAPIMPDIFYFRYLNWEKFVFEWKLKPKHNGFNTKYTAWFKGRSEAEFTPCDVLKCDPDRMSICIAQNEYSCTVPTLFLQQVRTDGFIHFKVNGTNKAGNVTSETVEKELESIVEPGLAKNLEFQIINGSDSVSYQLPDSDRYLEVLFRLVSKENTLIKEWNETKIGKRLLRATLPILKPHTEYQLSIRTKYHPSRFHSKWTNVTFISHEEAPSQSPRVCGSCFERESDTLTVHFQPLTREQSRGNVTYTTRLLSLSNGSSVPEQVLRLRYSKGAAVFKLSNLSRNVAYYLNISASTSSGSSHPTYIDIPTMPEVHSYPTNSNCTVMNVGDDTEQVIVSWSTADYSSQTVKSYTIFWCNGSMNRLICDDPLEWMEVGANESSALVRLVGGHSGYMFGIGATEVNGKSSGIQWSCFFYDIHSVGLSPYIHPRRMDQTEIEIRLDKPPHNPKKGFVYGYNLYYGEQNDSEFRKIYLDDRTTRGIIVIDGLASGRSYLLRAESLTLSGPSDVNATTTLATKPFSLSPHAIAGIAVVLVFLLIFAIFGCVYCLRYPFRFRNWIEQLKPCMPEVVTEKSYYDEQYPAVSSDYCVVVETSSKEDDHHLNRQNNEGDAILNCSALKSSDECVSLSASKMLVSPSEFSYVESDLTKILPSLEDCLTKPDQRPEVVNSSLTDRFANNSSSDAESDYLTSNRTANSDDSKDRAFLVPENSRISTPGVGVSRVVGDPDETRRLLPGVTEQRHPRPSLLTATRNTTNRPTVSADGFGPDVFEPVLSVLPQMTATASSVLPSVHADDSSEDENILPKIGTDFVGSRPYGEVGVVGCYEVSSASSDGSGGTGDRIRSSTGVSPVDPSSSFRSTSLSGYSSSCDGTDASYAAASSDRTNATPPASNSGDEGIYI